MELDESGTVEKELDSKGKELVSQNAQTMEN